MAARLRYLQRRRNSAPSSRKHRTTWHRASRNSGCSRTSKRRGGRLGGKPMTKPSIVTGRPILTRRQCLTAAGAGVLSFGFAAPRPAAAAVTIRQGYQTNIWGMPTYYLIKSGYLEKHGLAFEEYAVPSGNLTMQQMVGRQVDLGTYAGQ